MRLPFSHTDEDEEEKEVKREKKEIVKKAEKDPTRWIALALFFIFLFISYLFWKP